MSGHSKWSTIKHQKAIDDAKKGASFTKIAKKIHIAVKRGLSGDINANPFLRTAVDEARSVNMPSENVKRAIEKALGTNGADQSEEVIYEAYGPGGVGIMITAVTDNRNRTAAEMNSILNKHEAKLGGPGSVSYMKLINPVPTISVSEDNEKVIQSLIDSMLQNEDVVEVWSNLAK
jgi:YebC/PmpR family DNA-binding regulatory protein